MHPDWPPKCRPCSDPFCAGSQRPTHATHTILYLEGSTYKSQLFWTSDQATRWLSGRADDGTYALVNLATGLAETFVVSTERHVRGI